MKQQAVDDLSDAFDDIGPLSNDQLQQQMDAELELVEANRRVDNARINWEIANGNIDGPGSRGLQGLKHVIADQVLALNPNWKADQQELLRDAIQAEIN